jgi:hypothetical protein
MRTRWLQTGVVLILSVGGSANKIISVVNCGNFNEKCYSGELTETLGLYSSDVGCYNWIVCVPEYLGL